MEDNPFFTRGKNLPVIGVAGLGLIGGSLSLAFARAGYEVVGCDRDADTVSAARASGAFASVGGDPAALARCDYIFVALYPDGIIDFVKSNADIFKKGCVVVDCCGVKTAITRELFPFCRGRSFLFTGGHPMAGTERAGFRAAFAELFASASFILTPPDDFPASVLERLRSLLPAAGFARTVVTTPQHHDRMIAFTSQLPHVIACAYVRSECCPEHAGYSAGSYRDVSRVAHLNPELWADLFINNSEALLTELDSLTLHIGEIRAAVAGGDRAGLAAVLKKSRTAKDSVDYAGKN